MTITYKADLSRDSTSEKWFIKGATYVQVHRGAFDTETATKCSLTKSQVSLYDGTRKDLRQGHVVALLSGWHTCQHSCQPNHDAYHDYSDYDKHEDEEGVHGSAHLLTTCFLCSLSFLSFLSLCPQFFTYIVPTYTHDN